MPKKDTSTIQSIANSSHWSKFSSIHYSYILVLILGVVFGVTAVILLNNYAKAETLQFSTLDLINLVFSIGLSAGSTVLAVAAIVLSKTSEQSITQRNDEGMRLQNDIFEKTIEVLGRIESSSGINEKRIDDISKRIGDITHLRGPEQDRVREVIREGLTNSPLNAEDYKIREEEYRKENEFSNKILTDISNIQNVNALKIGSGSFDGNGADLVDGLYKIESKSFSISTFYIKSGQSASSRFRISTYKDYILRLVDQISNGTFDKCFLVFNIPPLEDQKFSEMYQHIISSIKEEVTQKIIILHGDAEKIVNEIKASVITS